MLVIGIVGGIASGKSLVAGQLAELGAAIIHADLVGHEVLGLEHVKQQIRDRWGESLFDSSGSIVRRKLARLVFAGDGKQAEQEQACATGGQDVHDADHELTILEQITHPEIGRIIQLRLQELQDSNCPVAVLDAPILIKAGWDRFCDRIVFVQSAADQRKSRAAERGWDEEMLQARERFQTPIEEKLQRSTDVIDNTGDKQNTFRQVRRLWESWRQKLIESAAGKDR